MVGRLIERAVLPMKAMLSIVDMVILRLTIIAFAVNGLVLGGWTLGLTDFLCQPVFIFCSEGFL